MSDPVMPASVMPEPQTLSNAVMQDAQALSNKAMTELENSPNIWQQAPPTSTKTEGIFCTECRLKVSSISSLKKHMATAHPTEMSTCILCNFQSTNSVEKHEHYLDQHYNKMKRLFECSICQHEFALFQMFEDHLQASHARQKQQTFTGLKNRSKSADAENIDQRRKPACVYCFLWFDGVAELQEHIVSVHQSHLHTCTECKYKVEFNKREQYEEHIKTVHLKDRTGSTICSHCSQKYADVIQLSKHIKSVHPVEQSCPKCSLQFRDGLEVHSHFQIFHMDDASFATEGQLDVHIARRQAAKDRLEKTSKCSICFSYFIGEQEMEKHLLQAHKITTVSKVLPTVPSVSQAQTASSSKISLDREVSNTNVLNQNDETKIIITNEDNLATFETKESGQNVDSQNWNSEHLFDNQLIEFKEELVEFQQLETSYNSDKVQPELASLNINKNTESKEVEPDMTNLKTKQPSSDKVIVTNNEEDSKADICDNNAIDIKEENLEAETRDTTFFHQSLIEPLTAKIIEIKKESCKDTLKKES